MGMKIATVIGARPQFIKAAMFSRALEANGRVDEVLIHTGQHFDRNMSQVFFDEMGLRSPDINLGISGGSHAEMTGRMLPAIEHVLMRERPQALLVYGDTNSTLAGALAAAKLRIPVIHAEAGFRTHHLTNPEELNRICTDHISSILFAPIPAAMDELKREGLGERAIFTGDLMYDAFVWCMPRASLLESALIGLDGKPVSKPSRYYYLTCHRQENTNAEALHEVLRAVAQLDAPVIWPVHPRVESIIQVLSHEESMQNVLLVKPVGYLESLALLKGSVAVVTDSGGLQREAFFAQKKCVTLLPFSSADETLQNGRNTLVSSMTAGNILAALDVPQEIDPEYQPFGDGHAAEKMVCSTIEFLEER